MSSDFGKGLVVCLAKFYEHFGNETLQKIWTNIGFLEKSKKDQELIMSDKPPDTHNYGKSVNEYFKFWMTKIVPIYGGNIKDALSSEITTWANGASDHLYEIECPSLDGWDEIRVLIEKIKNIGLEMGHGRGLMGQQKYTIEDVSELRKMTENALVMIDEKLGMNPDIGTW